MEEGGAGLKVTISEPDPPDSRDTCYAQVPVRIRPINQYHMYPQHKR